ncbi:hypothetical protein LOK49_LG12G00904 [Camellia lanceoleosa]|uniref:Uncharacterized protein n=1 Tax=Camellia lanceoleosa TaxID=1840588 RepID=A0ACC0FV39_9ERIC|nr:hypothetical protein LOK49_LG12G00904 [Camellia lanceoleosa]
MLGATICARMVNGSKPNRLISTSDSGQGAAAVSIPHVKLRIWAHDIKSPCDPLDGERCRLTIPHAVLCREGARVLWSYVDRILGQPSLAAQFEIRQLNLKGARLILGNAIGKAPKDKDLISGKAIVTPVFDRLLEKKHVASKAIESSSSGVVKLDMDSSRNPESGEDRHVTAPQEACNQIAEVVQEALKKMEMVADEKMRMFKKAHQALEASELELDEKAREVPKPWAVIFLVGSGCVRKADSDDPLSEGVEVGVGRCFAVVLARCKRRESCLSIASDGTEIFAGAAGYSSL